jgi:hypothetical protein
MYSNTVIDTSVHADVQPVSAENYGLTGEWLRLARRPSYAMYRRQLAYGRGCSSAVAGEIIRRATSKNDSAAHRNGHIVQAPPPARSVPPTGMRLTRILEMFREHLHSVARQIGPEVLLKYVEKHLRQDFQKGNMV